MKLKRSLAVLKSGEYTRIFTLTMSERNRPLCIKVVSFCFYQIFQVPIVKRVRRNKFIQFFNLSVPNKVRCAIWFVSIFSSFILCELNLARHKKCQPIVDQLKIIWTNIRQHLRYVWFKIRYFPIWFLNILTIIDDIIHHVCFLLS